MTQCGTSVGRLYKNVIEEVIAASRENFLDEGIDEQVLNDLKQQWEAKLTMSKAAEHTELNLAPANQSLNQQMAQTQPAARPLSMVPVQITVPSQQTGGEAKTITIHVPSSALSSGLAGVQLQSILGSPSAAQTFTLEASQAAEIIQRQLNAALQQNGVNVNPGRSVLGVGQVDGVSEQPQETSSTYKIESPQKSLDRALLKQLMSKMVDGAIGLGDSSDEISDDDEEDDDEDEDKEDKNGNDDEEEDNEEELEGAEGAVIEEPLNSEDDVSDDGGDIFETENVVVCQYDRITRVRNKWRFHLKDGIMHLKNKDYVFTKAVGEGEW